MGNSDTKLSYRQSIVELTSRSRPIEPNNEEFWSRFWHENYIDSIQDLFTLLTGQEIRQLRDESPSNLATLCYKAVEQMVKVTDTLCNTTSQQKTVLTCTSLLTRIMPYIFEDCDWRQFFWSNLPANTTLEMCTENKLFCTTATSAGNNCEILNSQIPLAQSLLLALSDLLFCPDFTVAPLDLKASKFGTPDTPPEDLQSIDSCEYIWEAGVGCSIPATSNSTYDQNRTELLRLLLTCFSESMYCSAYEVGHKPNQWIEFFTSNDNRHALPLFTSLLNTVFSYNPNSYLPFNHLLFTDTKEPLVEVAVQILIVVLDHDFSQIHTGHCNNNITETVVASSSNYTIGKPHKPSTSSDSSANQQDNLFINYISRIHREEDFEFLLKGFTRLLNNPLQQSYIPNSNKRIQFHQELLVLFWKLCDYNKKFMYYVLKTCDVLKILVPILYHLNDARADRSRVGLVHIGVFIILLLSGERNFGVRLNRPYLASVPMDLPIFSGTHADLLVIVFHKLITTGHQRLQPLFDCLLTILVNVSPYLKTLSMVASAKILHLLEAFSTSWFLFSNPTNHHLVFFLLEIFNNIIQYQFDGNSNLIYTIIRKRHIFYSLANLPTDYTSIQRTLNQNKFPSSMSASMLSTSTAQMKRLSKAPRKLTRPMSLAESSTINYGVGPSMGHLQTKSNPSTPLSPNTHSFADFDSVQEVIDDGNVVAPTETGTELNPTSSEYSFTTNSNVNVTLAAVPKIDSMTEKTHPNSKHNESTIDAFDDDSVQYHNEMSTTTTTPINEMIKRSSRNSMSRQSSTGSEMSCPRNNSSMQPPQQWAPTSEWILSWKQKLPLQTIMRMLQVSIQLFFQNNPERNQFIH